MSDDLLDTVSKALALHDEAHHRLVCECVLCDPNTQLRGWLRALLARCEAAEGCDGNCSCVVMSRHEWQRAYSEERLKREAAEAERDALRTMNDPEGGEKQALIARLVKAESELAAARAEVARLREALGSIARNTCCDRCQEAALVARAALDTPAREGGEGR